MNYAFRSNIFKHIFFSFSHYIALFRTDIVTILYSDLILHLSVSPFLSLCLPVKHDWRRRSSSDAPAKAQGNRYWNAILSETETNSCKASDRSGGMASRSSHALTCTYIHIYTFVGSMPADEHTTWRGWGRRRRRQRRSSLLRQFWVRREAARRRSLSPIAHATSRGSYDPVLRVLVVSAREPAVSPFFFSLSLSLSADSFPSSAKSRRKSRRCKD